MTDICKKNLNRWRVDLLQLSRTFSICLNAEQDISFDLKILKSDKTKSKNIIFNPLDNFRKMYVTRHYTSPCCFSFVVADKVCIKSLYIEKSCTEFVPWYLHTELSENDIIDVKSYQFLTIIKNGFGLRNFNSCGASSGFW